MKTRSEWPSAFLTLCRERERVEKQNEVVKNSVANFE